MADAGGVRRLEAILAADVAGYSRLMQDDDEATVATLEYVDTWSNLAWAYLDEYRFGYNTRPDALERALKAAQRAVQLAPDNQAAQDSLVTVQFFRGDLDAFLAGVDHVIALNPNNANILATKGLYLTYAGRWEKGLSWLNRAMSLEPNPPGWFYFGPFFDHYRKGQYEAALNDAQKMNMPDYVWAVAARAAAYGELGRIEEAKPDLKRILELKPDFEATARQSRWKFLRYQEPLLDQLMDGLRKAGLKIPDKTG